MADEKMHALLSHRFFATSCSEMKTNMTDIKRKGTYIMRRLLDEYVLIPSGETAQEVNQVITLSETAAFVYDHIPDAASSCAMAKLLSEEYGLLPEDVMEDVELVLKTFKEADIIESR